MKFTVKTRGHYDFVNITEKVREAVRESGMRDGIAVVFIPGTTAGLTAMEYEGGIMKDLIRLWERFAPEADEYEHHKKWGDHNGAAHVKSAILKSNLAIPVDNGELTLGTWQSVVLVDFDERPRTREVIVQIIKTA